MRPLVIVLCLVATTAARPQQAPPATTAGKVVTTTFSVVVPHEEAELMLDGEPTRQTGAMRVIELRTAAGKEPIRHEFAVTWKPNSYTVVHRKKTVEVRAGDHVSVDLTIQTPTDRAEVIYVPTPPDIVRRMVQLADVRADDVVFELGCGDARIVIAAVKDGGARRGVGIDRDEERVIESTENVKTAGVASRIEIRQGDIFDDTVTAGLSNATLVMLYMSDELNLLLRPKLLRTLKPGARIVSHRFTMGDWPADRTEEVTGEDGSVYRLHLWTVKDATTKGRAPAGPVERERGRR